MAITTYAELQTAVANWLADSTLTARIPEMIALAEAEFNRTLNVMEMEDVSFVTTSGEYADLPADFSAVRAVYIVDSGYWPLEQVSFVDLRRIHWDAAAGKPTHYALVNEKFALGPTPDAAYRLEFLYVKSIPALSDAAPTNWLLTAHSDLYLMGALLQAEFFGWNDGRLPLLNARVQTIIEQINRDGNSKRTGAAPIRMRHGVRE